MADINDVFEWRWNYHDGTTGERCVTTMHVVAMNATHTSDSMQDLVDSAGSTTLKDAFKAMLRTNWVLDPQNPGDLKNEVSRPLSEAGTLATTTLSPHAATGILKLYTNVASRRSR